MREEHGYIIRTALPDDLEAIHTLESKTFSSGWTLENTRRELAASFSRVLVAESSGSVVGYISAWLVSGEIQINRLAVLEGHRRRGIASRLVAGVVEACAVRAPYRILLEVRERNEGARSFYRSLGFSESGIRKGYYRDDNALLMDKEIAE